MFSEGIKANGNAITNSIEYFLFKNSKDKNTIPNQKSGLALKNGTSGNTLQVEVIKEVATVSASKRPVLDISNISDSYLIFVKTKPFRTERCMGKPTLPTLVLTRSGNKSSSQPNSISAPVLFNYK